MAVLLISVRFHDGRYHGHPDWPPAPARLFQALIAGAAQGGNLPAEDRHALGWLELLQPPVIAAPRMRPGQGFTNFVPNNDRDAVEAGKYKSSRDYLKALAKIRTEKHVRPLLFEAETPLLYAWSYGESLDAASNASRVCAVAERLYQLGRGVDMAWAWGEILSDGDCQIRLDNHGGAVYRPGRAADGIILPVPLPGSLASLIERHEGMRTRFRNPDQSNGGKAASGQVFTQPPRPRFRQVAYGSPPTRLLFDLAGRISFWRLDRIVDLTMRVRDEASKRLNGPLAYDTGLIRNVIVGRRDGAEADKAQRVRIAPLASIGHPHADHAIRRILVEIPANCPLRADDVEWAFSGPALVSDQGEIHCELAPAVDRGMLAHYGIGSAQPARLWRTVTPAALQHNATRRQRGKSKGSAQRIAEEGAACSAVVQALRHAGLPANPLSVLVQREPFESNGARAEAFGPGTRFGSYRLWHVEIAFADALCGPLVLGDGRYLGLGLMAPVTRQWREVAAFSLPADARVAAGRRTELLRAVRRALMALARDANGRVPQLFSGHEGGGAPARSGRHRHIFLAAADLDRDGCIEQVMVAAPWTCDRSVQPFHGERAEFDHVVGSLEILRAGELGAVRLRPSLPDPRLVGPARIWRSYSEYWPTRHVGRGKDPAAALLRDMAAEIERRGLPRPALELLDFEIGPNEGVKATFRLEFAVAVPGPILLGRDSHHGGGVFEALPG